MGAFSDFALIPEQGALPEMEQLPGELQEAIRKTAARLRVSDASSVAAFGARAQKEMSTFSEIALRQMMSNDIKPLDGLMKTLAEQIRSCSFKAEAKGFLRRITGGTASLEEVRAAYEKAEPQINACANDMTDRRVALMRDSALMDRLYDRNETLYRELCSLLVIGREAQQQAKEANLCHFPKRQSHPCSGRTATSDGPSRQDRGLRNTGSSGCRSEGPFPVTSRRFQPISRTRQARTDP